MGADHLKWYEHYNKNNNNNNGRGLRRIFHEGDAYEHNWLRDKSLQDVEILLSNAVTTKDGSSSLVDTDKNGFVSYTLDGEPLVQVDNGPDGWATWMTLKGEPVKDQVIILHTPGHSPGSLTLYRRPLYDDKNNKISDEVNDHDGKKLLSPGILFTGDTYGYSTRGHKNGGGAMSAFPRFGHDLVQQAVTIRKFLRLDWQVIAPGHGHPRDYRSVIRNDNDYDDEEEDHSMRLRRIQEKEMDVSLDEMKSYQ